MFSAPHLLPSQLRDKTGVVPDQSIDKMYNAYVATGGYVFGKDPAIVKFRPTGLIKWQQGLPKGIPQIDISPAIVLIDRLWLGVTYRMRWRCFVRWPGLHHFLPSLKLPRNFKSAMPTMPNYHHYATIPAARMKLC